MRSGALAPAAAVLSAMAASACCWLPLVLLGTGLSAAGVGVFFERFRVPFLISAGLLLAAGFYLNYRPQAACAPDGSCPPPKRSARTLNRLMLWISTALVVAFAFFPSYASNLFAGAGSGNDVHEPDTLVVGVVGMTCGGCEAAVETALLSVVGVASAEANFAEARAVVIAEHSRMPSRPALASALGTVGYQLASADGSEPGNSSQVTGEWIGDVRFEDSTSVQMVVDLGLVGSRIAGEFDVLDWGVENYPVSAALTDSTVRLHFAGPNADFMGTRSGETLTGVITFEDRNLPITLRRVGGAQFSETFLALESAADDSTLVVRLSPNGAELREQFNADANKTRLLMLLSPT